MINKELCTDFKLFICRYVPRRRIYCWHKLQNNYRVYVWDLRFLWGWWWGFCSSWIYQPLKALLYCEIAASQRKIQAQKKLKLFCVERRGKASKWGKRRSTVYGRNEWWHHEDPHYVMSGTKSKTVIRQLIHSSLTQLSEKLLGSKIYQFRSVQTS
jgi:hypothetical protein